MAASDGSIALPGGLRLRLAGAPERQWRYAGSALGLRRGFAGEPVDLTVRFVPHLPRGGREGRIGEFAGWSGARFWVGDLCGRRLEWSPEAPLQREWRCEREFAPDALWAYLWWALRVAWWTRGAALLHASAAVWRKQGLLLMGWSGAGKTTALRELLRRGAAFLGDDWVVISPGRIERCGLLIGTPGGRRVPVTRALPGTTLADAAPLSTAALLLTVEEAAMEPDSWDAREAARRMAACHRHEGALFAQTCEAYRFFRPGTATAYDSAEARDAQVLADLFAGVHGSCWPFPPGADPGRLAERIAAWLGHQ